MYKNIDLSQLDSIIDIEIAEEFIDHRIYKKAKLTQASFNRLMKKAIKISHQVNMTPNEILTETIDNGWQGFRLEYFKNRQPQQDAFERLNDTSWSNHLRLIK
tara:strand:+ start:450 stop:758 length:309 start_codon:yes stop_codon:yes gene_type:complete